MPVNKIAANQFVTQLNQSIQAQNPSHDTEIGPVPDLITRPHANVLEDQNDRIRLVSLLISLINEDSFTDVDVENFVFNENIIRLLGGRSSGTAVFSRATAPAVDVVVQQNFPIATAPDTETGETVTFVTTESKTLTAATASAFFNIVTQRFELEVAIQAVTAGKIGEVGPNRVVRPLRPLTSFDDIFNRNRTSTVSDLETNPEVLERYKISILGTQIATKNGRKLFIEGDFADAGDVLVVNSGDPLITRSGVNGSAVDIFITGSQSTTRQDTKTFIGLNQLIVLDNQPILNIVGISGFIENTDFVFVPDTSGVSGSTRAQDAIKFIPGGNPPPTVGTSVVISYEQDILIANIQSEIENADNDVGGQDALARRSTQVNIIMAAQLIVVSGFSFSTVQTAVQAAIINFINALGLDDDVEESDLQGVVRGITGVDNFIFSVLDKFGGGGKADIPIAANEFPRIVSVNISITP